LDERQADKGVLLLEGKAVGVGLVPALEALCGTIAPGGFEVTKTEDQGLAGKKFEEDADKNGVVSERTWRLPPKGREGRARLPTTFRFAAVKLPAKEVIYQRYSDADLAAVGEEVSLEKTYGQRRSRAVWVAVAVGSALLLALGVVIWIATRRKPVAGGPAIPE